MILQTKGVQDLKLMKEDWAIDIKILELNGHKQETNFCSTYAHVGF